MQGITPAPPPLVSLLVRILLILFGPLATISQAESFATPIPPGVIEIIEAPVGGLRKVGSPSSLEVNARGAGTLRYQWYRGTATSPATPIPGAVFATYTLDFPTAEDTAYYSVRISNLLGSITSEPVLVSYEAPIGSLARRAASFYRGGANSGVVNAVIPSADGSYVVAGAFSEVSPSGLAFSSVTRHGLVRIRADGTLDTAYPSFPDEVIVHDMVEDSQGRLILVFNTKTIRANGVNVTRNGVARILANGSLDPDFIGPFTAPSAAVRCLALDSTGRIYIGAESEVIRVNPITGAKDPTFTGGDDGANSLITVSNGTLVFAGTYGVTRVDADIPNPHNPPPFGYVRYPPVEKVFSLPGTTDFLMAGRHLSRGLARRTINNGDGADWLGTGPQLGPLGYGTGTVSAVLALPSGNLVAAGLFGSYNDTFAGSIVHLAPDGTLAPGLDFGTGFYGDIRALALGPNGELFVGGSMGHYNQTTLSGLAIVNITTAAPAPPDPGAPVPDALIQYLIDAGVPANRQGTADDYDGDGAPNAWEYYIGTDPSDPASVILRLWASTRNNNIPGEATRTPDTLDYAPGTLVNVSAPLPPA